MRKIRSNSGSALVEFALVLPMLFVLIVNVVNFGVFLFAWVTIANAARSGSQYMVMGGATVGAPTPPSASQIYNVVTADVASLLNRQSISIRVCTNNNGVISCNSQGTATFSNPSPDTRSEASLYVMSWVDVQYTYLPPIPLMNFSALGLRLTLPPSTLRRTAVMRMLQ